MTTRFAVAFSVSIKATNSASMPVTVAGKATVTVPATLTFPGPVAFDVKVTGTTARAIAMEFRTSSGKTATAYHTCQVLLQTAAPTPSPS